MKKQFLIIICVLSSLSVLAQTQGIIVKNIPAPKALDEEFYDLDTSSERRRELANLGYIDFMESYCRRVLFFNYVGLLGGGDGRIPITNSTARDVLPLLEAGAKDYADFQFMYACILSGCESIKDCKDEISGELIKTPADYQYMDLPKAKIYFQKYLNNPNKADRRPFGCNDFDIIKMIHNVFPELIVGRDTVSMADVEEKPIFQGGGIEEFKKWVYSKLIYPEIAKKYGVQGRVTLQFVIDTEGSIGNIKILRGVDSSLDNEAIRVVSSSPKWVPGKKNGSPVNTKVSFPVVFQLR